MPLFPLDYGALSNPKYYKTNAVFLIYRAASSQMVVDPSMMCRKLKMTQASGRMSNICRRKPQLLEQITKGINLGQHECQYQFRNRRWNCTSARRSIKHVILRGEYILNLYLFKDTALKNNMIHVVLFLYIYYIIYQCI